MCLDQLLRYLYFLFGQPGLRRSRQILRLWLCLYQFLRQVHRVQVLYTLFRRDRLYRRDGILFRRLRRDQIML